MGIVVKYDLLHGGGSAGNAVQKGGGDDDDDDGHGDDSDVSVPGSELCSYELAGHKYPGLPERFSKCPKLPVPPR